MLYKVLMRIMAFVLRTRPNLLREFWFDFQRFNQSQNNRLDDNTYELHVLAHSIEKGLATKNRRTKFGSGKILRGKKLLSNKKSRDFGSDFFEAALFCYENNQNTQSMVDKRKFAGIRQVNVSGDENNPRTSCRYYSQNVISQDIMHNVISQLYNAPSQCNRQTSFAHYIHDYKLIQRILEIQGGAESFRCQITNLLVITGDLSGWFGASQRNQVYVDGGIFVGHALEVLAKAGLGSCALNCALLCKDEEKILKMIQAHVSSRLIALISFGYPDLTHTTTPASPRRYK